MTMPDAIDRAFQKWKDGDRLSSNEEFELKRLAKEHGTQRASDYAALKASNKK